MLFLVCSLKVLAWALRYLKIMVQQGWLKATAVSGESLTDNKSSKSMTLGQVLFHKRAFLDHLQSSIPHLVMGLGGDKDKIKDELELVLAKFLDLEEFEKFLPSQAVESEERDRDMAAEQAVVQQDGNDENSVTNPCDDFAGSLTAPAKSLFKLLHDFPVPSWRPSSSKSSSRQMMPRKLCRRHWFPRKPTTSGALRWASSFKIWSCFRLQLRRPQLVTGQHRPQRQRFES